MEGGSLNKGATAKQQAIIKAELMKGIRALKVRRFSSRNGALLYVEMEEVNA